MSSHFRSPAIGQLHKVSNKRQGEDIGPEQETIPRDKSEPGPEMAPEWPDRCRDVQQYLRLMGACALQRSPAKNEQDLERVGFMRQLRWALCHDDRGREESTGDIRKHYEAEMQPNEWCASP